MMDATVETSMMADGDGDDIDPGNGGAHPLLLFLHACAVASLATVVTRVAGRRGAGRAAAAGAGQLRIVREARQGSEHGQRLQGGGA